MKHIEFKIKGRKKSVTGLAKNIEGTLEIESGKKYYTIMGNIVSIFQRGTMTSYELEFCREL